MSQRDLFRDHDEPDLFDPPRRESRVSPDAVRAKLLARLAELRAADEMPWNTTTLRYWRTVFPQMTNWLPDDDAAQLRFAFVEELKRLKAA